MDACACWSGKPCTYQSECLACYTKGYDDGKKARVIPSRVVTPLAEAVGTFLEAWNQGELVLRDRAGMARFRELAAAAAEFKEKA